MNTLLYKFGKEAMQGDFTPESVLSALIEVAEFLGSSRRSVL